MEKQTKKGSKANNKRGKVKVFTKKKPSQTSEKAYIEDLQTKYKNINLNDIKLFVHFPLSVSTVKGLKQCGYIKPTKIQQETIGLSLQGKDILGAAQTGSGKTLAFLIPILELLFCKQWTRLDGTGALVITPTRELAYQIFETLRNIGRFHDFSAGLIIGGKDLKFERNRMDQCNIVICTPGRLLQHMDENPLFNCVNLQILVLDEADRCLDMGFQQTMNAIICNLPPKRQTLLFSATQTKSVKDLVRLSLKDPCYISVYEHFKYITPTELQQNYVVCELQEKISVIWSFIRNHLKQKCIIFLSSCKQVKYMYEIFCRLRPGVSLLALYGTLHQLRRMSIYDAFCQKTSAVLFATDIAARGLDFPQVHWVVQADCPEDTDTYIHRVGRTARFHRGGESLLLLLHSEKAMVDELIQRKIPISKIEINPNKLQNPVRKMEAYLAKYPALKEVAQRAFVSYAKSVFLMKNKNIFNVNALDTDSFAKSYGLAVPPRIRFLQRLNAKNTQKKISHTQDNGIADHDTEERDNTEVYNNVHLEDDKQNIKHEGQCFDISDDLDSDDGILKVKRRNHDIDLPTEQEENNYKNSRKKKALTKAAIAKKILKKKIIPNKKICFDDEGNVIVSGTKEKRSELALQYEQENVGGINVETAKMVLQEEDKFDKQLFKQKVKVKHKDKKRKLKQKVFEKLENSDFESESESDGPDLAWLPDPDKIYGKRDENNDESDIFENQNTNEQLDVQESYENELENTNRNQKVYKRKVKVQNGGKKLKKRKFSIPEVDITSINEAEELAMMLLQNKS